VAPLDFKSETRIGLFSLKSENSPIYQLFMNSFWFLYVPIRTYKFPINIHKLFTPSNIYSGLWNYFREGICFRCFDPPGRAEHNRQDNEPYV